MNKEVQQSAMGVGESISTLEGGDPPFSIRVVFRLLNYHISVTSKIEVHKKRLHTQSDFSNMYLASCKTSHQSCVWKLCKVCKRKKNPGTLGCLTPLCTKTNIHINVS